MNFFRYACLFLMLLALIAIMFFQNSVKHNLTQGKYFTKVTKKDSSSKSYLWEINPACNIKLRDSSSSLLLGKL